MYLRNEFSLGLFIFFKLMTVTLHKDNARIPLVKYEPAHTLENGTGYDLYSAKLNLIHSNSLSKNPTYVIQWVQFLIKTRDF